MHTCACVCVCVYNSVSLRIHECMHYYYGQAGVAFDVSPFPKLKALHGALRADPALALYFASDMYKR